MHRRSSLSFLKPPATARFPELPAGAYARKGVVARVHSSGACSKRRLGLRAPALITAPRGHDPPATSDQVRDHEGGGPGAAVLAAGGAGHRPPPALGPGGGWGRLGVVRVAGGGGSNLAPGLLGSVRPVAPTGMMGSRCHSVVGMGNG
jgi:hypothetical protein